MPVPQQKSSKVIDEINAMIENGADEARIDAIRNEIRSIEKAGMYSDAKQLEGMLAGLLKNEQEVRKKFNAALMHSGNDPIIRLNFGRALSNVGCMQDSVKEIDVVREQCPDDIDVLLAAFELHKNAYDVEGCFEICEQIDRLGMHDRITPDQLDKLNMRVDLLSSIEVRWQDIADRIERAFRAVFKLGLPMTRIAESIMSDSILMEFEIVGSIDDALRAERAIHEAIAAQPYSPADKLIAFACGLDEHCPA